MRKHRDRSRQTRTSPHLLFASDMRSSGPASTLCPDAKGQERPHLLEVRYSRPRSPLSALTTPCPAANNAYSAAGVISQAEPSADQSAPKEASCWHPDLSRNIGIAELSCDSFN